MAETHHRHPLVGRGSPRSRAKQRAASPGRRPSTQQPSGSTWPSGWLQHWWAVVLRRPPRGAAVGCGTASVPSLGIYGLARGEADSVEGDSSDDSGPDELTARALRDLQRSPEFARHLAARHLTQEDVGRTAETLRLYRRLRRLDPPGFWALAGGQRPCLESQEPSRLVLAADYLLGLALSALLLSAAAAWLAAASSSAYLAARPAALWAARCTAGWLAWAPVLGQWAAGRPVAGRAFGLWYEELRWGHAPPAWRGLAAGLLELAYVAATLGVGLLVSLALRCLSGRRQSVGELCAGVRAMQEWAAVPAWEAAGRR